MGFIQSFERASRRWAFRGFRGFFGLFFLLAGLGHAFAFPVTVDGARIITEYFSLQEVASQVLAIAAIVCLIFGGLSLLLGFRVRTGALSILLFLIPATLLHILVMQFAVNNALILKADSNEKAQQIIRTLANIAIQGHQGNLMKNIVLMMTALFFMAVPKLKVEE